MAKKKSEEDDGTPKSSTQMVVAQATKMMKDRNAFVERAPGVKSWNSTGSTPLDYMIGNRVNRLGLPAGRVVEFFGPESGGKTGLAMEAMAEAQRKGGYAQVLAGEPWDDLYAEMNGLDITNPDKFGYFDVNNLEGAWGLMEACIIARHKLEVPTVILFDSLSALGVKSEGFTEMDTDDSKSSAANAKFLHYAFRRSIMTLLAGSNITVIMIRHRTASPRPDATIPTSHGSALNFHASLRLHIHRTQMEKEDGVLTGYFRHIRCHKNKVGIDGWVHSQPTYIGVGRDPNKEIILFLKNHGVMQMSGAWLKLLPGTGQEQSKYERDWVAAYRDDAVIRRWFDELVLWVLQEKY